MLLVPAPENVLGLLPSPKCFHFLEGKMKILVIASVIAVGLSPSSAVGAQACHAADTYSAHMITVLNSLMTPADSIFRRDQLHLPAATSAQISLVSNDSVCIRARQALDSLAVATNPDAINPDPPTPLYVFAISTHFGIVDPTDSAGEWIPLYFFGPLWNFLSVHLPF